MNRKPYQIPYKHSSNHKMWHICSICDKDLTHSIIHRLFDNSFCSGYCKDQIIHQHRLYAKDLIKRNEDFLIYKNCVVNLMFFKST